MHIEMWSDLVCPWCFIGKRQLEIALEQFPHRDQVTINHRAYQLNPHAEPTTTPTTQMLADKYGVSLDEANAMLRNVSDAAKSVGLNYQLERTLSGNTRDGHRLVLWAQRIDHTRGQQLLEILLSAYFERGESIFGHETLAAFAPLAGFDATEALTFLHSNDLIDAVRRDQEIAQALGCTGVPFFVIDDRFGVTGAQSSELFASALQQAWDSRNTQP
jgi:predicted DsbA family dithiol-disulfide isomerase